MGLHLCVYNNAQISFRKPFVNNKIHLPIKAKSLKLKAESSKWKVQGGKFKV